VWSGAAPTYDEKPTARMPRHLSRTVEWRREPRLVARTFHEGEFEAASCRGSASRHDGGFRVTA
jgi:hypothetical protein